MSLSLRSDIPLHAAVRYVPALTGMRALAAILVLLLHTNHFLAAHMTSLLPFLLRGYLGVDFFFVLSGFIITHVYLASFTEPTWHDTRVFFWHRFVRLYPVHITVLAMMLAMFGLAALAGVSVNNPGMLRMGDLYAHILLIQAWGVIPTASWNAPSWSISAEWFAYLLFPAIAIGLLRLRNAWTAWALAALTLIVMMGGLAAAELDLEYSWLGLPALVRVTGEFICGAALCRMLMLLPTGQARSGPPMPSWAADAGVFAAFIAFLLCASVGAPDWLLVALFALAIVSGALSQGTAVSVFGRGPMKWLGEVSYSIYMVHMPILIVVRRVYDALGYAGWGTGIQRLAFAGAMVVVIVIAAMMYYAVERPARERLRNSMGIIRPGAQAPRPTG